MGLRYNSRTPVTAQKPPHCSSKSQPRVFTQEKSKRLHLLALAEGLSVKKLDELDGHLVRVVGAAVRVLLLQEVDLQSHRPHILPGRVKAVVLHYRDKIRSEQRKKQRKQ